MLLAALLHTCSLDIGIWIEDWLQGFQKNAQSPALEEGSFPLAQITTVVSVINQQRRLGRNVFAVSQAEDDGGGNGKVDSYDSQEIKVVWLHGRERATGARFQEPVRFGAWDYKTRGAIRPFETDSVLISSQGQHAVTFGKTMYRHVLLMPSAAQFALCHAMLCHSSYKAYNYKASCLHRSF